MEIRPADARRIPTFQGGAGVLDERALDDTPNVLDMATVQGEKDGALVGEVLIHGAHADAGDLRDPVLGENEICQRLE
jgi:hypothetical protein